ncbi:sidekick-1-like isoform X1 [Paramuricea clavata]|uniref:Sidekick-1-like isoform X1 n=1 Tax=Paramuricea clavata TaxID=317549 RepID=A0A6S7IQ32_PARCT|nr:sidekick-1-like isoform X1 [Paramuricea clavata]
MCYSTSAKPANTGIPKSGPNITQINATSSTSIAVTWGEVPAEDTNGNITHYFLCYKVQATSNNNCSNMKRVDGVNNRSTVLNNLNEFTTYVVAIKAATSKGAGPPGLTKIARTSEDVPKSGPNITQINATSSTSIAVTWGEVPAEDTNGNITHYFVCYQVQTTSNNNCSNIKRVDGVNNRSIVLNNLNEFTTYVVAIKAATSKGAGPPGLTKSARTSEDVPKSGPNITQINATSSTSIAVTWGEVPAEDTNGNITHYFVCYKVQTTSNNNCSNMTRVDGVNNRSTVLNNLNEFTTYIVAIKAATSKGPGPPGLTKSARTSEDVPKSGPNITQINVTSSTSIAVTWGEVPAEDTNGNITHYFVCYQVQTTSNNNCSNMKRVDGVNNRSTVLNNLNEFTTYVVAVKAATSKGAGQPGLTKSARTCEDVPKSGPNITQINATSSTSIAVTWGEVPAEDTNGNITHYFVCYKVQTTSNNNCSNMKRVDGVNNRSIVLNNLNEFTTYVVAIKAATSKGAGPPGLTKSGRTSEDVLTNVLNSSMRQQRVPSMWKLANLSPLPKESPLTECDQLSPISLTNVIMRLFERIIFQEEIRHPSKLYIDKNQYAYRENSNTTAALIKCQHHWLKWLDDKANFIRVISFDFSKAFDSVPHDILTQKLKSTNLNPYIINWLINFISCRKQIVTVDGTVTNFVNINKGVPQVPKSGPNITHINATSSTSIAVRWGEVPAEDTNGNITHYFVCYKVHTTSNNNCSNMTRVDGVNNRSTVLNNLNVFTTYVVAVKAATSKGAGPAGLTKIARTSEDVPKSGPNITQINVTSSTSIAVTWGEVPAEDTNGNITHYFVCYKVPTSSNNNCSNIKRVDGVNNRSTVLNNLNEFTTYVVAIKAATSKGAGPPGLTKSARTSEDGKY